MICPIQPISISFGRVLGLMLMFQLWRALNLPAQAFEQQPFDAQRYRRGIQTLRTLAEAEAELQQPPRQHRPEQANAPALYLRPHYQSQLLLANRPPEQARAVVLLLHGFTAGPWQYQELMEALQTQGFHSYAPRLPGHGWMTAALRPSDQYLVRFDDRQRYEDFLVDLYVRLQSFQVPIYAVGLSGGGNLALRMAEKYPDIQRVVAVSPFLGADYPLGFGYDFVHTLQGLSGNHFHPVMARFPTANNRVSSLDELLPHTQGTVEHAYSIFRVGRSVQKIQARAQFFTTEGDVLSGKDPVKRFFKRLGGLQRHGWYHYPITAHMPHAMISPRQHHAESVAALHQMIAHFLKTGERFLRLPAPPAWWCQREARLKRQHRQCVQP